MVGTNNFTTAFLTASKHAKRMQTKVYVPAKLHADLDATAEKDCTRERMENVLNHHSVVHQLRNQVWLVC